MPTPISVSEFLDFSKEHPVFDVRSPNEYELGHIPGAHSLPLFTNEERKVVGIAYKQVSREAAVNLGIDFFTPKMKTLVETAKKINNGNTFLVHCWRGGMRSGSVAWLLELYGYKVYLLKGGYKAYRNVVLEKFEEERELLILGGRTGSGKTLILHELEKFGEQILDLEKLAHHKGSAFGGIGEEPQPTQEMFENELFFELSKIDKNKRVWVEDESNLIGSRVIPQSFYSKMREAQAIFVNIPFEARVEYITNEYGKFNKEDLKSAIQRITKRLGGLSAKHALEAIDSGNLKYAFELCLAYYDKTYDYGKSKREKESITNFSFDNLNVEEIAKKIKNI